ncbi:MAG: hypothetical protein K5639_06955 [Eubacterium sp.]|nr:hypothetical protein [Eubacterium sp.]
MLKEIFKYIAVFAISVAILFGLIVASELISKDAMKEKMLSSAEKMCENPIGVEMMDGVPASKLDRYADSLWLNIAWHSDGEHPFSSAMWSSYTILRRSYDAYGANQDLLETVRDDREENIEYLRYWHGPVALIRFFHLFTDIQGMYIINAVLIFALYAGLVILMWRKNLLKEALCLVVSVLMAGVFFVPFCFEYVWIFYIVGIVSILTVLWGTKGKYKRLFTLFLISGIVTNYFDFLTTEILTLLIPLLLLLAIRSENESDAIKYSSAKLSIKAAVLWGIGYCGMWIMKWVLASIVLGENVLPYVTGHISQRVGTSSVSEGNPIKALVSNIITILPVNLGDVWAIFTLVGVIILICFIIIYKKKEVKKEYIILYGIIALIPYIRYIIMNDHSCVCYTFTYRSQMATVFAIGLLTLELVSERVPAHGKK